MFLIFSCFFLWPVNLWSFIFKRVFAHSIILYAGLKIKQLSNEGTHTDQWTERNHFLKYFRVMAVRITNVSNVRRSKRFCRASVITAAAASEGSTELLSLLRDSTTTLDSRKTTHHHGSTWNHTRYKTGSRSSITPKPTSITQGQKLVNCLCNQVYLSFLFHFFFNLYSLLNSGRDTYVAYLYEIGGSLTIIVPSSLTSADTIMTFSGSGISEGSKLTEVALFHFMFHKRLCKCHMWVCTSLSISNSQKSRFQSLQKNITI